MPFDLKKKHPEEVLCCGFCFEGFLHRKTFDVDPTRSDFKSRFYGGGFGVYGLGCRSSSVSLTWMKKKVLS